MAGRHYVCERCGGVARIVHHRQYITPQNINDPAITLNWANLEALCIDCHNAEHTGCGVCAPGLKFNNAGELIPVSDPPPCPECTHVPLGPVRGVLKTSPGFFI